jgi:hypothetical protein
MISDNADSVYWIEIIYGTEHDKVHDKGKEVRYVATRRATVEGPYAEGNAYDPNRLRDMLSELYGGYNITPYPTSAGIKDYEKLATLLTNSEEEVTATTDDRKTVFTLRSKIEYNEAVVNAIKALTDEAQPLRLYMVKSPNLEQAGPPMKLEADLETQIKRFALPGGKHFSLGQKEQAINTFLTKEDAEKHVKAWLDSGSHGQEELRDNFSGNRRDAALGQTMLFGVAVDDEHYLRGLMVITEVLVTKHARLHHVFKE